MQVNLNTLNTAAATTATPLVPAAQNKTTNPAVTAAATDTVTLSAEAKAKLAAETLGNGSGNEPPITKTLGNGSGNEPPITTFGNGSGNEPPIGDKDKDQE